MSLPYTDPRLCLLIFGGEGGAPLGCDVRRGSQASVPPQSGRGHSHAPVVDPGWGLGADPRPSSPGGSPPNPQPVPPHCPRPLPQPSVLGWGLPSPSPEPGLPAPPSLNCSPKKNPGSAPHLMSGRPPPELGRSQGAGLQTPGSLPPSPSPAETPGVRAPSPPERTQTSRSPPALLWRHWGGGVQVASPPPVY